MVGWGCAAGTDSLAVRSPAPDPPGSASGRGSGVGLVTMRGVRETRGSGERRVPGEVRARRGDAGQVGQRDAGRRQRVSDAAFEGAVAGVELRLEPGGGAEIGARRCLGEISGGRPIPVEIIGESVPREAGGFREPACRVFAARRRPRFQGPSSPGIVVVAMGVRVQVVEERALRRLPGLAGGRVRGLGRPFGRLFRALVSGNDVACAHVLPCRPCRLLDVLPSAFAPFHKEPDAQQRRADGDGQQHVFRGVRVRLRGAEDREAEGHKAPEQGQRGEAAKVGRGLSLAVVDRDLLCAAGGAEQGGRIDVVAADRASVQVVGRFDRSGHRVPPSAVARLIARLASLGNASGCALRSAPSEPGAIAGRLARNAGQGSGVATGRSGRGIGMPVSSGSGAPDGDSVWPMRRSRAQ